jgi:NAD+ diphosphatase
MGQWWFAFRGSEVLVRVAGDAVAVPSGATPAEAGLAPGVGVAHALETVGGDTCIALDLGPGAEAPAGMAFRGLRSLFGQIDRPLFRMAGRACQVVDWDRTHQFCGRCGTPTELSQTERVRRCPSCGQLHFPRVAPAVITLIRKGDEILLARAHNFPGPWYGLVAGFVEPGETLEEALQREVAEEVGLAVTNIRYWDSQPWPFPHSLMVGFTADYAGGELRLQADEIADARWFSRANLPELPPPISIARRLVEWWKQGG